MSINSFVIKNANHTAYLFEVPQDETGFIVLPPTIVPITVDEWCGKLLRACSAEFNGNPDAIIPTKSENKAESIVLSKALEFIPIDVYRVLKTRYPADYTVHVIENNYLAFIQDSAEAFEMPLVYCENPVIDYTVYGAHCSAMSVAHKTQTIVTTNKISNGAILLTINKRFGFTDESLASLSKWYCKGHPVHSIVARVDPPVVEITTDWTCADCDKKQLTPACFVSVETNEAVCYECTKQSGEKKYSFFPQGQ
jgi:hypothetical protein